MKPVFTVDWETWFDGLNPYNENRDRDDKRIWVPTWWLLNKLYKHKVKAIFYCVGWLKESEKGLVDYIVFHGHTIKSHGYYHTKNAEADRKPYSFLGFCGGFYFRLFPYWLIKLMVKLHNHFYIHPHDLDEEHPQLRNPIMNWKRHLGLKTAKQKLERLLEEIEWQ